jgi:hypothetical protein
LPGESVLSTVEAQILKYLLKKYKIGRMISLSEAMLESNFDPETFGEAVTKFVEGSILVLSSGGTSFSDVQTKKGVCDIFFDVNDDEAWQRWKHNLYAQGFTNEMRNKIVKLHSKIPLRASGKYRMDYARITPKSTWKQDPLEDAK